MVKSSFVMRHGHDQPRDLDFGLIERKSKRTASDENAGGFHVQLKRALPAQLRIAPSKRRGA